MTTNHIHIKDLLRGHRFYPWSPSHAVTAGFASPLNPEGIEEDWPSFAICLPTQTHTSNVAVAVNGECDFPDTDALITTSPELAVGVRTADCVPVLIYAPDIRAVAAIHAGWKGTIAHICANTIERLKSMGANASAIRAAIGPSICGACYEVSEDLALSFEANFGNSVVIPAFRRPHLDLCEANRITLLESGLSAANITLTGWCTHHSHHQSRPIFPSWRRDIGTSSRLISFIVLNP